MLQRLWLSFVLRVARFLLSRVATRHPDFVIGTIDDPYLLRWWIIPRNRFFNVYLHQFLRSDDDRALHDHPWLFNASFLLHGEYTEHTIAAGGVHQRRVLQRGAFRFRLGSSPHRVELPEGLYEHFDPATGETHRTPVPMPCWTVFISGPRIGSRESRKRGDRKGWGFHCPQGWVHFRDFTDPTDYGNVGKGCGE